MVSRYLVVISTFLVGSIEMFRASTAAFTAVANSLKIFAVGVDS
jgi:hypothetical protein